MRMRKLINSVPIALLTVSGSCMSIGVARSEVLCHVADPIDTMLNVRSTPGGAVVNRLKNGRLVRENDSRTDSSGGRWSEISGIYRGDWRNWGWAFRPHLKCIDTDNLPHETPSFREMMEAGIAPQSSFDSRTNRPGPTLPVSCDLIPNGWGVTLSKDLYQAYRRRGFSITAVCLGLGSWGVHFDPATGRRLPLYKLKGDELRPLWLSDCFRQVHIVGKGGYLIGWRPADCGIRYHPSTGQPIDDAQLVELSAGGEAGGGVDVDNRSSTVTQSRLRSLLRGE